MNETKPSIHPAPVLVALALILAGCGGSKPAAVSPADLQQLNGAATDLRSLCGGMVPDPARIEHDTGVIVAALDKYGPGAKLELGNGTLGALAKEARVVISSRNSCNAPDQGARIAAKLN